MLAAKFLRKSRRLQFRKQKNVVGRSTNRREEIENGNARNVWMGLAGNSAGDSRYPTVEFNGGQFRFDAQSGLVFLAGSKILHGGFRMTELKVVLMFAAAYIVARIVLNNVPSLSTIL